MTPRRADKPSCAVKDRQNDEDSKAVAGECTSLYLHLLPCVRRRSSNRASAEQPGDEIAPSLLFRDVERRLPGPRRGPVQIGAVRQQVLSDGELPAMACVPERP